ncbi:MAG: LuxR family transcriptional regulator [Coriobacteriia bacterium]
MRGTRKRSEEDVLRHLQKSPVQWTFIIIGLGLFWQGHAAFIHLVNGSTPLLLVHYISICIALSLVCLGPVASICSRLFSNWPTICCVYLLCVVSLIMIVSMPSPYHFFAVALSGIAFALMTCAWFNQVFLNYSSIDGKHDFTLIASGLVLSIVIGNIIPNDDTTVIAIGAISTYIISMALCIVLIVSLARKHQGIFSDSKSHFVTQNVLRRYDLGLGFILFSFGTLYGLSQFTATTKTALSSFTSASYIGFTLAAVLLFLLSTIRRKHIDLISLFPLAPVFASAGVLIYIFSFAPIWLGQSFYHFAHGLFYVFTAVFIVRSARAINSPIGSFKMIAFNRFLIESGTFVGISVSWIVYRSVDYLPYEQIFISALLLLLLVSAVLIPKKQTLVISGNRTKPLGSIDLEVSNKCAEISRAYSLSKRESEILFYLVQGWPQKMIADTLVVAPSTIKAHTKHIYDKLNIHAKGQLIDLFRST